MNNSNGAALLARVQYGALVTIRRPDGRLVTGRADGRGLPVKPFMRTGPDAMPEAITAANIVRVQS